MKNGLKGKPIEFIESLTEDDWNNLNAVEQNYGMTRMDDRIDSLDWAIKCYEEKKREHDIRDDERNKSDKYLKKVIGLFEERITQLEAQVPTPEDIEWLKDEIDKREKDAVRFYIKNRADQKKLDFKDFEIRRNSVANHKASQYTKREISKDDEMVALNKINANIEKYLPTQRQVEYWKTYTAFDQDIDATAAHLGVQPKTVKGKIDEIAGRIKIAINKESEEKNAQKKKNNL